MSYPSVKILGERSGNLLSVKNSLNRIGIRSEYIPEVECLSNGDTLILPGMRNSYEYISNIPDLFNIKEKLKSGKLSKVIGICAGFQILTKNITESGKSFEGLGILNANTAPISPLKHSNNGWLRSPEVSAYIRNFGISEKSLLGLYFNHSCGVVGYDKTELGYTYLKNFEYAISYHGAKIHGLQFHPEKSGRIGLDLLRKILL